jgi:hypothetical protein
LKKKFRLTLQKQSKATKKPTLNRGVFDTNRKRHIRKDVPFSFAAVKWPAGIFMGFQFHAASATSALAEYRL